MRRTTLALLLLAAACAPAESTTDTPATDGTAPTTGVAASDLAGTWTGTTYRPDGSPMANTEMTATDGETGWRLNIVSAEDTGRRVSTDVRVISTAGDSVVIESGPFASVVRPGEQVTVRSTYRRENGRLVGTSHLRYATGDTATVRSEMTRR